jgi:hypothetical protein
MLTASPDGQRHNLFVSNYKCSADRQWTSSHSDQRHHCTSVLPQSTGFPGHISEVGVQCLIQRSSVAPIDRSSPPHWENTRVIDSLQTPHNAVSYDRPTSCSCDISSGLLAVKRTLLHSSRHPKRGDEDSIDLYQLEN